MNTLEERPSAAPIENLATYRDLTRFAALAGLIDDRTAARLQQLETAARILRNARASFVSTFTMSSLPHTRGGRRGSPISTRCLLRSGGTRGPDAGRIALTRVGRPPLVACAGA